MGVFVFTLYYYAISVFKLSCVWTSSVPRVTRRNLVSQCNFALVCQQRIADLRWRRPSGSTHYITSTHKHTRAQPVPALFSTALLRPLWAVRSIPAIPWIPCARPCVQSLFSVFCYCVASMNLVRISYCTATSESVWIRKLWCRLQTRQANWRANILFNW